ncbi:MAG: DUF4384 domain-containing protein [Marivita sp.]|uniref:DUF4384 domain-containing protein n=1 Tax=Marivita sp. TaxID=2003365 RepID=UPI0025C4EFB8|nr:DUF4384 domain-containing protein [Marivita sp.]MCI5110221.1 DUF4384 domain-containing protein [Marivita sp.]
MRGALTWALALIMSVGAHGAGAYAIYLATRPGDIPDQPVPETRMELTAYQVQRSTARETAPDADQAMAGDTSGTSLGQGVITTSSATPIAAEGSETSALAPESAPLLAQSPTGAEADIVTDASQEMTAITAPQSSAPAAAPVTDRAQSSAIPAQSLAPTTPRTRTNAVAASLPVTEIASTSTVAANTSRPAALPVAASSVETVTPAAFRPEETEPSTSTTEALAPDSASADEARPEILPVAQTPVDADAAAPIAPKADRARAALAFQGTGEGAVDPVSLSAFQSFMEPGDLGGAAADVRDGITGALSAVPCSRLQVQFDPSDNTLLVSGHVPEPELRSEVVAAMQAQMGADIPVRENLLILPRPQCGALSGIASVGLPQSTDQITNPLLVGDSTHAREFRYTAGNPLVMTLQGADYDAYVYVDYFDADGNVLHLSPNQFTPLSLTPAEAALQIGAAAPLAAGEPGLYIEIGPPFGQEIAVAFASSVPLYDGVRPLVEPAGPYLDWLRDRVSDARAREPDFKGEWVYFFVTTAAE